MSADVVHAFLGGIELEDSGLADDLLLFFDDGGEVEFLLFDEAAGEGGFDFIGGEPLCGEDDLLFEIGGEGEVNAFGASGGGLDFGELAFDGGFVGEGVFDDGDVFFELRREGEAGGDEDDGLAATTEASAEIAEEPDDAVVAHVGVEIAEEEEGAFGGFEDAGEDFEFGGEGGGLCPVGSGDGGLHALGDGPGVELALEFGGDAGEFFFDAAFFPGGDPDDGVLGSDQDFDFFVGVHGVGLVGLRIRV